jgi:hypothetical protein
MSYNIEFVEKKTAWLAMSLRTTGPDQWAA